jgi:hypothetical protein
MKVTCSLNVKLAVAVTAVMVMTSSDALGIELSGQVFGRGGVPVPGLRVMVSCASGVQESVFTRERGLFSVFGLREGDRCGVEVHWGRELVYRDYVTVSGRGGIMQMRIDL